jgi:hypothetical protein
MDSCFRKLKSFFLENRIMIINWKANVVLFQMFTKIQMDNPLTLMEAVAVQERTAGNAPIDNSRTFRSYSIYWKKFHTNPKRIMKSRYG